MGFDVDFNPRAPSGARLPAEVAPLSRQDFNPRAPSGARQHVDVIDERLHDISIHALRAERDSKN